MLLHGLILYARYQIQFDNNQNENSGFGDRTFQIQFFIFRSQFSKHYIQGLWKSKGAQIRSLTFQSMIQSGSGLKTKFEKRNGRCVADLEVLLFRVSGGGA